MTTLTASDSATTAQYRAIIYAGLAHGFRYPDEALCALMRDDQRYGSWSQSLACLVGAGVSDPFAALRDGINRSATGDPWTLAALQDAHNGLFGHAVRGRCPAYESEYGSSEINQRASQLADLAGFYEAFGVVIVDIEGGRPDFISVEREFMSLLCAKEALAFDSGDEELLERCRNAQRNFLKDHLARWLPAFARRVIDAHEHALYTALGDVAERFVGAEARRYGIATGPRWLELRPADQAAETSIDCFDSTGCGPQSGEQFTALNIDLHHE